MILVILLLLILYISSSLALIPNNIKNMFNNMNDKKDIIPILDSQNHQIPKWEDLMSKVRDLGPLRTSSIINFIYYLFVYF